MSATVNTETREMEALFRQFSDRQIQGFLRGIERYEDAGAPYGPSAADMIRWLEDQPGGFPDPDSPTKGS